MNGRRDTWFTIPRLAAPGSNLRQVVFEIPLDVYIFEGIIPCPVDSAECTLYDSDTIRSESVHTLISSGSDRSGSPSTSPAIPTCSVSGSLTEKTQH